MAKTKTPKYSTKTDDYVVKKSSAGFGLFAARDFAKGEQVIEYIGPILNKEEADKKSGKYLFEITEDKTIDGTPRYNIARYINHSHKPNCEPLNEDDKHIYIETIRKIKKGEEFTYDYGKEYVDEFIKPYGCKCAACEPTP